MPEGIDWLKSLDLMAGKKVLCLVDGEHYPPVTEWAVGEIGKQGANIVGMAFIGGTEKIGDDLDVLFNTSKYRLFSSQKASVSAIDVIKEAVEKESPDLVIDLSDVPVVDYKKRFTIASFLLNEQITYAGSDFIFQPPAQKEVLTKPSISILGTGKRIGKTAVSITVSRILKQNKINAAVVAMGRGGPPEPVVLDSEDLEITPDSLLKVVEEGEHAASDYWENAILSGIPAIGCRRCGGGFAGNPFISNVPEGAKIANEMPVDLVIMEGSGPTRPPVKTGANILVLGAHQPLEVVTGYLDEYRLLNADLVVITMCEQPGADPSKVEALKKRIRAIKPELNIALTVFRPEPMGDIRGKKIFYATTAPEEVMEQLTHYLEEEYQCALTGYTTQLSNRPRLRKDLEENLSEADILLTEIKAASIDVAVKTAKEHDMGIVFSHNRPALIGGSISDLDQTVLDLCRKAGLNRGK